MFRNRWFLDLRNSLLIRPQIEPNQKQVSSDFTSGPVCFSYYFRVARAVHSHSQIRSRTGCSIRRDISHRCCETSNGPLFTQISMSLFWRSIHAIRCAVQYGTLSFLEGESRVRLSHETRKRSMTNMSEKLSERSFWNPGTV